MKRLLENNLISTQSFREIVERKEEREKVRMRLGSIDEFGLLLSVDQTGKSIHNEFDLTYLS